jgi:thiamine pyrophosphate-dependent acetolactate synthase large subunit-like protein
MGLYNAWCDRVPMLVFGGNSLDAARRRPGVEWYHSMQDPAGQFRDYLKNDDQPVSLQHFADSTVRAYRMAMSPPMAPVMISLDIELQEEPVPVSAGKEGTDLEIRPRLMIPPITLAAPPVGDARALEAAARLLVAAERPLIVVDRATRNQDGVRALVELAEALQAPVVDTGSRMNFPGVHPCWQSGNRAQLVPQADVILMLEVADPWAVLHGFGDPWKVARRVARRDVRTIHVTLAEFLMKSNFQDMQRFQPADVGIAADAQATIPALTEAVRRTMSPARAAQNAARADALRAAHTAMRERLQRDARYGWDARPVTTGRLALEVHEAIKDEDWCLQAGDTFTWAARLWPHTQHHNLLGHAGGAGVGYTLPASIGAALANRDKGILTVSIQPDGDFLMAPGVLWTAAHHRIPLLIVMFNNRAWAQEVMHLQRMANLHQRDPRTVRIGTEFRDPDIDYAKLAQGFGVWAEGPIVDPRALQPALRRALQVVKGGAPALIDVVCQMR